MGEEISLSIDETNALRAKLGLCPLKLNTEDETNTISVIESKQNVDKPTKSDEYHNESKRMFDDISGGGGILDILGDLASDSEQDASAVKIQKSSTSPRSKFGSKDDEDSSSSDSDSSSSN